MPGFSLGTLVGDESKFLKDAWDRSPHVSHGQLKNLGEISKQVTRDSLIRLWKKAAIAWRCHGQGLPAQHIRANQIRKYFDDGFTIYLTGVEDALPALRVYTRVLEKSLMLRRGDVICEAVFSKSGSGAKAHFDPNMAFNVQLTGRKKWKIAPNDCVSYPHEGGALHTSIREELLPYLKKPFPKKMPKRSLEFETKAGSVVYIPSGYWHETKCKEESLSLLFTVAAQPWYSLITKEIEKQLRQNDFARQIGITGNPRSRVALKKNLRLLRKIVLSMDAERLLTKWHGPPFIFDVDLNVGPKR